MRHEEWKPYTTENCNYLYHYARKKLNDPALIQDLIQDTFLVALESHDRFEHRSSELTWLTAILKHKIYRVYRSKARAFVSIPFSGNLILPAQSYERKNFRFMKPKILLFPRSLQRPLSFIC